MFSIENMLDLLIFVTFAFWGYMCKFECGTQCWEYETSFCSVFELSTWYWLQSTGKKFFKILFWLEYSPFKATVGMKESLCFTPRLSWATTAMSSSPSLPSAHFLIGSQSISNRYAHCNKKWNVWVLVSRESIKNKL